MPANLSLALNVAAVVLVGTSVAIVFPGYSDYFLSIGMAYLAGLLTATGSRYSITLDTSQELLKNEIKRNED